jgi:hypothetical protein
MLMLGSSGLEKYATFCPRWGISHGALPVLDSCKLNYRGRGRRVKGCRNVAVFKRPRPCAGSDVAIV